MKLALGLMFTNGELPYLKLHLPVTRQGFDGVVAITDRNTSNDDVLCLMKDDVSVHTHDWLHDWGYFSTLLALDAEAEGYDAVMRLDPDECLQADAGHIINGLLENEASLLVFPRYEFYGDRCHYRADLFPDHQARAWRLRRGIVVGGRRHEGIDFAAHGLSEHVIDPDRRVMRVSAPQIFHYGYASVTGIRRAMERYQNHARHDGGLEPIPLDPNVSTMQRDTVPFEWHQPLDPQIIGATAPWKE